MLKIEKAAKGLLAQLSQARQLVAILNRDGGHHQDDVGFVQACKDAESSYNTMRKHYAERVYSLEKAIGGITNYAHNMDAAMELIEDLWDAYVRTTDPLDDSALELRARLVRFAEGLNQFPEGACNACGAIHAPGGNTLCSL